MQIGTTLKIIDDQTSLCGALVTVTDIIGDRMTCQIVKLPETDRFMRQRQLGTVFHLGALVFVREGQYEVMENSNLLSD